MSRPGTIRTVLSDYGNPLMHVRVDPHMFIDLQADSGYMGHSMEAVVISAREARDLAAALLAAADEDEAAK